MIWIFVANIFFVFATQELSLAERNKEKTQKRETVISRQKKAKMEEQRNSNTLTNKPWSTSDSGDNTIMKKQDRCQGSGCQKMVEGEYYYKGKLYKGKYDATDCTGWYKGKRECH